MKDDLLAFDSKQTDALMRTASDANNFIKHARAQNTQRAYASDWAQFSEWIESHGLDPLPSDPRMVALWLTHMARQLHRKRSTIKRMMSTISVAHRRAGHPNPCEAEVVRESFRGISNVLATDADSRATHSAPLLITHLEALSESMGDDLRAVRDRAVVLVGWSGALRRGEIAALDVEDLAFVDKGVRVRLPRSKTDQTGEGQHVAIFYATRKALCPVQALRSWTEASEIRAGALFRPLTRGKTPKLGDHRMSARAVDRVVKRWTAAANVQPEQAGDRFGAHSLRAGFVTEAARADRPEYSIAKQTRHRSAEVLRGYIRIASVFEGNAGEGLL